ncbi:MAG: site-specific integrase [Methanosarcinaceae archaeon]|nr:site-specific integrase [Methanosarcinaceae archaeon]
MTDQFFTNPGVLHRLHAGPLGSYVDSFAARLSEQGYAKFTIKYRIRLIAVLSRWMHRQRIGIRDLDEQTTVKFLKYLGRKRRIQRGDMPTLRMLLEYLRQLDVIPTPVPEVDDSKIGCFVCDYAKYLLQERGLSQACLNNYLPVVRRFLEKRFGTQPVLPKEIDQTDISHFVLRHVHNLSRGRAKLMVTALRSFFRFLQLQGDINTNLAAVVPTVANWRFTTLPKWIPPEQVENLLKSCDQSTIAGQRNYTILLLLARLGLRSGEIVTMTLDDIDWEAGEIIVGGKSRRQDRLPLPKDVGEALAKYLRYGRPRCSTRQIFVRMRAPLHGFMNSSAIYSMVRRSFDRAGIHPAQKGPHILRHSLATNMLRRGASLGEISEILRHQSICTTQIYAKVDLEALRKIAQSWPGGEK